MQLNSKRIKVLFTFLRIYKYEILLFSLLQHLYTGIFLTDLELYTKIIWPINMLFLGIASIGIFIGRSWYLNQLRNIFTFLVIGFPIGIPIFGNNIYFVVTLCIVFCTFYIFIFIEILRFLLKPSYIDTDIITASACGYLLLIEIMIFLMQAFHYTNVNTFKGIIQPFTVANSASVFMDLVYFCSITISSIGYGDITPNTYPTKLIVSLFGILGQFYSVVLVGILISKFTSEKK